MTEKEKLLEYIIERPASATSRMSYYAINETFTIEEINSMSDKEVENLVRLGDSMSEIFY